MKSKLIIIGILLALVAGWWFWPTQLNSKLVSSQAAQEVPRDPLVPSTKDIPAMPVIDQNTNLSEELNKLTLPDPSPDYQRLDGLVNSL